MKHIKLFETVNERNTAELIPPYLVYIKETDTLETRDHQAIEKYKNPQLMALCYSKGWCDSPEYMTSEECAAVTNAQFNGLTNTQVKSVKSFEELKYFTGLTTLPKNTLFNNCVATIVNFPPNMANAYESAAKPIVKDWGKLVSLTFPDNLVTTRPSKSGGDATVHSLIDGAPKLKHLDLSNTKLTEITNRTFQSVGLNSLILPKTIKTCATQWGFDLNNKLKWLKLYNTTPVTNLALTNSSSLTSTSTRIYVPDEAVDTYKAATNFSSLASNIYSHTQWQEDINNGIINYE